MIISKALRFFIAGLAYHFSAVELKNTQGGIEALENMVGIEKELFVKNKISPFVRTLFL